MSNKKIYKGLNKRRKFHFRKFITILLCIILIVGYTYKKIKLDEVFKNVNISNSLYSVVDKLYFWKNPGDKRRSFGLLVWNMWILWAVYSMDIRNAAQYTFM